MSPAIMIVCSHRELQQRAAEAIATQLQRSDGTDEIGVDAASAPRHWGTRELGTKCRWRLFYFTEERE